MRSIFHRPARSLSNCLACVSPFKAATVVFFALALGCSGRPSTAAPATGAPAEYVVMISLDGMPAYLFDDPKVSMPNLHALAKRGVRSGGMRVSNPSVTWPNHTTLVTGMQPRRHGVLANGVLVRGGPGIPVTIDPRRDKSELVRTATVFDVAHAAGLITAAIQWPCTRSATTIDNDFQEFFHPDGLNYTTPRLLQEMIDDGILPQDPDATYRSHGYPWFDHTWTSAACNLIAKHKPNLLLLHLLNCDTTHHQYGPQTQAGYTAVAYADTCVARVLAAIDAAGIGEKTAVFIVSDHGFTTTEKALLPNTLLRQEGWLRTTGSSKIEEARVSIVPEGGVALVYFTDPAHRRRRAPEGPRFVRRPRRHCRRDRAGPICRVRSARRARLAADGRPGAGGPGWLLLFRQGRRRALGGPERPGGGLSRQSRLHRHQSKNERPVHCRRGRAETRRGRWT